MNSYPHMLFRRHWAVSDKARYELGQADAIIQAICETPIRPEYHARLLHVSLVKGARATTAIEGNTLSEEEVELVARGESLPPSKEYQEIEVRNVLDAMNELLLEVTGAGKGQLVTPELIRRFHAQIGKDLREHLDAIPGRFREDERIVGSYKCPRHEDVPELVTRLCRWLQQEFRFRSGTQVFADAVIQAIVTHVYVEWIHPFGDGNGRTGRLLEFYILLRAGNPDIASHILSNFYNGTRPEYYRQLDKANSTRDLSKFIEYAVEGLRDGLLATLRTIQESQLDTAWRSFVYDEFAKRPYTKKTVFKRRRELMLAFPPGKPLSSKEAAIVTADLARAYAKLSERTILRDLEVLTEMGLLVREGEMYTANIGSLSLLMARRVGS